MAKASLGKVAYYLALIGGIILIIQGILSFVGMAFMMFMPSLLGALGGAFWGIIEIILGLVAIYGAKRASRPHVGYCSHNRRRTRRRPWRYTRTSGRHSRLSMQVPLNQLSMNVRRSTHIILCSSLARQKCETT